ncbi:MAG: hypothetical protein ACFFD4_09915 [Candidatus Odinarchaeota archaeon]
MKRTAIARIILVLGLIVAAFAIMSTGALVVTAPPASPPGTEAQSFVGGFDIPAGYEQDVTVFSMASTAIGPNNA